jgi:hypothetical protein
MAEKGVFIYNKAFEKSFVWIVKILINTFFVQVFHVFYCCHNSSSVFNICTNFLGNDFSHAFRIAFIGHRPNLKKLVAVVVSVLFPIAATLMELAKTLVADLHFVVHSTDKRSGVYLPVLRVSTKPIPCKGDFDCFVLGGRFGQKIGFAIANFKHVITLLFRIGRKKSGLLRIEKSALQAKL